MFSIAYVILPFSDTAPAEAIRASLARFQRGGRGDDLPDDWIRFHDETHELREAHEAHFTFTDQDRSGLRIEGPFEAYWHVDSTKVRDDMRRRGVESWRVRFADTMDLDTFYDRFGHRLERHPVTGDYGRWLNPLGRWDWWDLGGRFDGRIIGESHRGEGRSVAQVSSGQNPGRTLLSNIENVLRNALDQEPAPLIDVRSDRNIELAETLLADIRAQREHASPGALVLPPGSIEDPLRWLDNWPRLRPTEAFVWLGLTPDATWPEVVEAAYVRFHDHWVAGVAYHL